jgi:hypothetical protein
MNELLANPPRAAFGGGRYQFPVMSILLLVAYRIWDKNNRWTTTQARMASQLGISDRTLRRWLGLALSTGVFEMERTQRRLIFVWKGTNVGQTEYSAPGYRTHAIRGRLDTHVPLRPDTPTLSAVPHIDKVESL